MPRIRTINEAFAEIKEQDPATAISRSGLRRLVVSGTLPSTRIGRKYLVDVEAVVRYFSEGGATHE